MKLVCLGAGAVGTYLAGSLAAAGHAITFAVRPAAADALRSRGLSVRRAAATVHIGGAHIEADLGAALRRQPDAILFALKSYDTQAALAQLRAVTEAPPPIACFQNGVDNESRIAEVFGPQAVIAGTVTTAVRLDEPGAIVVERERGVGVAVDHPLGPRLAEALCGAGLHVRTYPRSGPMKWSKLLTNLLGNAASAILDLPVEAIYGDRRLFEVERAALLECLQVMRAQGCAVVDLPRAPVRALAAAVRWLPALVGRPVLRRTVGAGRGAKRPSLAVDLQAGRGQSEVGWLNGAVVRHGARWSVATPVNRVLNDTLTALADGRLSPAEFRGRPDALLRLIRA